MKSPQLAPQLAEDVFTPLRHLRRDAEFKYFVKMPDGETYYVGDGPPPSSGYEPIVFSDYKIQLLSVLARLQPFASASHHKRVVRGIERAQDLWMIGYVLGEFAKRYPKTSIWMTDEEAIAWSDNQNQKGIRGFFYRLFDR
jgi:hypothetical protein